MPTARKFYSQIADLMSLDLEGGDRLELEQADSADPPLAVNYIYGFRRLRHCRRLGAG